MAEIQEKIQLFLEKYNLLDDRNTFLIAFSGGADSLCLLDNMFNLSKQFHFKLIAAHLNHNWRGEESRLDEERAMGYCKAKNITFYSETLPENIPHTELEARNRRYEFLNRAAAKFHANVILTGHNQNDQVETILYRIIKGTGTLGLKGIPEVRYQQDNLPAIYRPILGIKREEIIKYCEENNLTPNIDITNLKEEYLRNRIRLSLLSELKTYNQNVEQSLLKLGEVSTEAEIIIEAYLESIKSNISLNKEEMSTQEFLKVPSAAQKRVIYDFLYTMDLEYDFKKVGEILDFIKKSSTLKSGNTLSITSNLWLFTSSEIIRLISSIKAPVVKSSIEVSLNQDTCHPGLNKTLRIMPWNDEKKPEKFPKETSNTAYVDLSKIKEPMFLRTRQEGDIIQPFGMKEKVKLKKYLINKGIPEFKRDELALLTTDAEVLWVAGIGLSELLKVKYKPTHILEVI